MATFNVKEKFEESIKSIWDDEKYKDIQIRKYGYALQETVEKNALLFIGINPSNANNGEWCGFYNKTEEYTTTTHPYFRKFYEISGKCKMPWSHIDLLFVRCTDQKEVEQLIDKGLDFIWKQLEISKQIIEEAKPKIIVVNNTLARKFLGLEKDKDKRTGEEFNKWMDFDFVFDENIGTYRIINNDILDRTPVFFTSMLTGQRALDKGSYERLIWHIKYANERLNDPVIIADKQNKSI